MRLSGQSGSGKGGGGEASLSFQDAHLQLSGIPQEELPLDNASPALHSLIDLWFRRTQAQGRIPAAFNMRDIPPRILPYVMLLTLDRERDRLIVRLAGTEVCQRHGGEMKGKTTDDFFEPVDAAIVVKSALDVAHNKTPSLARRNYVNIDGKSWHYTRLIMPLSSDGETVDGFFKTLDPDTLDW
ncbi:PAS domain-containing protein [Yunchengibacter salinarum]|uniref:PAS domain-containing protein n=1 Tax=Yunchengibacter salinarum TaxID=3133399 RepID=UPI0035B616E8